MLLQFFPDFVHYLLSPRQIANFHEMYDPANRRIGMREADTSMLMFGYYIWNNVRIGFQTFAGGMLAGVGSAFFLGANGVIIGAVAGYLTQVGYTETFWSFVAGHSSLELLAIVLSGAAGFKLGLAIIAPGNLSRKSALMAAAQARGAHHVRRGGDVLRRRVRRGVLVADHRSALQSENRRRNCGWVILLAYFALAGRRRATR